MMVRHGIRLEMSDVEPICKRWHVRELFVFGSFLRDDFGPQSDVDFVARLEPGVRPRVSALISLQDELAALTEHPVDIVLGSEIDSPGANPVRRQEILSTMKVLYG